MFYFIKPHRYGGVLFQLPNMKKTLCLLLLLFARNGELLSQDSIPKRLQHLVGFGLQRIPDRSRIMGHEENRLKYRQPGYEVFYRLNIRSRKSPSHVAITANFVYHKGWGYEKGGGNGGYDEVSGSFEKIDWVLSATQFIKTPQGKRLKVNIGFGCNVGGLMYKSGKLDGNTFNIISGSSTRKPKVDNSLNRVYLALNFELNIDILLTKRKHLFIGGRQFIERSDGFGIRRNFTSTIFVAYPLR